MHQPLAEHAQRGLLEGFEAAQGEAGRAMPGTAAAALGTDSQDFAQAELEAGSMPIALASAHGRQARSAAGQCVFVGRAAVW